MSDRAIQVENVSKLYHIGERKPYKTARESLMNVLSAPSRFAQRLIKTKTPQADETELWALRDVSFDVHQGEVVGIIGSNGAGKSTLLKVLSRITEPTAGRITIRGRVGSLLEVGTGFHPELTGRENVFLNGAILGMRRAEIIRKFDEIVAFAEIDKFIETPVKHYSSGMYMRLAFAVAAHLQPEILVVDEVLAVGDAQFQKKCIGKMGEIAKEGRTVLFVSHNMNAIESLCDRALLLKHGQVYRSASEVRDIIREHLFSSGDDSEAAQWTAPDCALDSIWFKPRSFFVCDDRGGRARMPCTNAREICFQIEGEIEQADPALNIGIGVYSEQSQLLFWSFTTDEAQEKWPTMKSGSVALRMALPRRFLNEGTYRVELLASLHFREWLLQPGMNAPSICLIIQGGLSDSPLWMARRPGALAPVFTWTNIQI